MSPIQMQLAPSAHVTRELRRLVLAAVAEAGVEVDGWAPLPGDPNPADRTRIATPSLRLIVLGSANQTAEEALLQLATRISDALARIRSAAPSLPISINAVSDSGTRWFAFRPSDSPDAFRRGVAALPTVVSHQKMVHGWDDELGKWIVI